MHSHFTMTIPSFHLTALTHPSHPRHISLHFKKTAVCILTINWQRKCLHVKGSVGSVVGYHISLSVHVFHLWNNSGGFPEICRWVDFAESYHTVFILISMIHCIILIYVNITSWFFSYIVYHMKYLDLFKICNFNLKCFSVWCICNFSLFLLHRAVVMAYVQVHLAWYHIFLIEILLPPNWNVCASIIVV
jgi:hypothetical protein